MAFRTGVLITPGSPQEADHHHSGRLGGGLPGGRAALLHELDLAFFEDRFEGASPTEQRVLEAMAREPGQIRLTRLRRHIRDVASLDLVVRRLVERGLIYRATRGTYDFSLPMFRAYVRRRQANLSNVSESERLASRAGPAGKAAASR